jgi:hypothetical protein
MDVRISITVTLLGLATAAGCGEPFTFGGSGGSSSSSAGSSGTGNSGTGGTTATSTVSASTGAGTPCTWNGSACGAGHYCDACTNGKCVPIPAEPPTPESMAVCGCDGVTYWNASTAASFSMATQTAAQCTDAEAKPAKCATHNDCNGGRVCDHEVKSLTACATAGGGVCVGLPPSCDNTTTQGMECNSTQCTSACQLLRGDKIWLTTLACH